MAKKAMRRRPARKGLRKRRVLRKRSANRVTGGPNTCRITETFDISGVNINTPYEYLTAGITAGTRSADVAKSFGLYRIAKVIYTYKPLYDTWIPQNQGPTPSGNFLTSAPNLYWKMIRYGDAPAAFDDDYLKEMGSRAHRLDDKPVVVAYRPNILLADAGAAAQGLNGGSGQVKMTPWLSTDSEPGNGNFALSTTVHYGHILYVEGDTVNGSSKPVCARAEVKVIYEFKNPRGMESTSAKPSKVTIGLPEASSYGI